MARYGWLFDSRVPEPTASSWVPFAMASRPSPGAAVPPSSAPEAGWDTNSTGQIARGEVFSTVASGATLVIPAPSPDGSAVTTRSAIMAIPIIEAPMPDHGRGRAYTF